MISLIIAISQNNIIGKNGKLPWHLNSDFKNFVKTTSGHPVIMGDTTYFSIPKRFRPLKNRPNIVLTRKKNLNINDDIKIAKSIPEAISYVDTQEEAFVIGGYSVYKQFLAQDLIDKLYITRVEAKVEGDTKFPDINWDKWELISEKFNKKTKKDDFDCTFLIYEKTS